MKSENKRLKDKAWKLFSQYIRRKYSNDDGTCQCFTCGKIYPSYKDLQCGHGIGGRNNAVLYEELVCRPQDYSCNVGKRGNYEIFIPKLIREIGQIRYEELVRASNRPLKRTKQDYLQLIRELEAQLLEYDEQGKP